MNRAPSLGAIVLAGGRSTRMGRDKATLDFEGRPLVSLVVERVSAVACPVVVVAFEGQVLPPIQGARVVRDRAPGLGPLEGFAVGLAALEGLAEAAFLVGVDAPFVAPELILRLEALRREGGFDAIVPRAFGHLHPLASIVRVSARAIVEALLAEGTRRASALFERLDSRVVDAEALLSDPELARADPELRSLLDLDTPEAYGAALKRGAT